ncbi:MAG: hypothetical protein HC886_02100 [Leptolyngbyaceae cyanobacterium SM1_1_3]|nr:hypothetical protein [Leptolyngbyaceae cyanobacterium SM1_1_3]NJN02813.1 hypothetical protein [Leptolyngbyaceae cyanobacterium RM1_1_2]
MLPSFWITGPTRSGKTTRLIEQIAQWGETLQAEFVPTANPAQPGASMLVFASIGDNRLALSEQIAGATQGRYAVTTTTPAGFIQDEVILFWPLLVEQRKFKAQFPLKLRPENEQELATRLWRDRLEQGPLQAEGWREYDLVRRSLDFLQLAALGGIPAEEIAPMLQEGLLPAMAAAKLWAGIGAALIEWRDWCLARGLLPYGVMTELYWRYLLPDPAYQAQLKQRFCAVLADDVDDYPAIARDWFEHFLALEIPGLFTYNPSGKARLGLGADPNYLAGLSDRCQTETLSAPTDSAFSARLGEMLVSWVQEPLAIPDLPESIQSIQAVSRGQLLRQTAETIAAVIDQGQVAAADIAVVGPGLDAIARYTLIDILTQRGVAVESLNDQRPPMSSPLVRALLTLLTLVYTGLGRLVSREDVAEMLVVLSQAPSQDIDQPWFELVRIDPVRAELLADHCFAPDPERPHLLPISRFPRWDRLGYQAAQAYEEILQWIGDQQQQQQQRILRNAVTLIDRALQRFLWRGNHLSYDQLAVLRELIETAQYYWEVEARLQQYSVASAARARGEALNQDVGRFVQLLRGGTVTANPHPVRALASARRGVTLTTVYQYRVQHLSHRCHFWLDAGSPRWLTGTAMLLGAPLFLQSWSGRPWTTEDTEQFNEASLARLLPDLLGRASERLYLCHSDLAISGQEQVGPLLTLVQASQVADAS